MNSAHLLLLSWVVAASGRPLATVAPRRREANVAPRRREQRVLMLISDTGGGHRASAMALEAMIKDLRPSQVDCKIVDIWTEYGAWPDNQMPRTYPFLCRHPMLWRLMFHASPLLERPWFAATRLTCGEQFRRCITEYDPDLVVRSVRSPCCRHALSPPGLCVLSATRTSGQSPSPLPASSTAPDAPSGSRRPLRDRVHRPRERASRMVYPWR